VSARQPFSALHEAACPSRALARPCAFQAGRVMALPAFLRRWLLALSLLASCLGALAATPVQTAPSPPPLPLRASAEPLDAWPWMAWLGDASHAWTAEDVWNRRASFQPPPHVGGSLGVRKEAVWLHLPVAVEQPPAEAWVLSIGYSSLQEVDFYLMQDGRVLQHAAMGYLRPQTLQSRASRTPAMRLALAAGERYDLLIRVRTAGPLILPITMSELPVRARLALREQMLQGLLNGLALCLVLYSLLQWIGLREKLFAYYALVVLGSAGFSLQYFGIGAQFLWPGNAWMEMHFAILAGLVALVGSFLFLGHILAPDDPHSRYARAMRAGAALMAAAALAHVLGLLSVRFATALMSLFGMVPTLASLPRAFRRMRRGDDVGGVLLVGWTVYGAAALTLACLVQGWVPVNFWTLHSFQFGATLDMLIFLRVLGLRSAAMRLATHAALVERDTMRSLAHTDALTGLPNRRSLLLALQSALPQCAPDRLVAVYLVDLDGFKPVNDRHGHDVGDELLVAVARRLCDVAGPSQQVARLGGDEFIVLATGLERPEEARALGDRLLHAFDAPFALPRHRIRVGLTVGYALAPLDATDAQELVAQADRAMYQGKQAGKHRLRRGGETAGSPAPTAA